jgi:hypothetical protein
VGWGGEFSKDLDYSFQIIQKKCEMKEVFVQNKEKTWVIFYKKFQCKSMSFSFLVHNPITNEDEWVTPLANLPLDINVRLNFSF